MPFYEIVMSIYLSMSTIRFIMNNSFKLCSLVGLDEHPLSLTLTFKFPVQGQIKFAFGYTAGILMMISLSYFACPMQPVFLTLNISILMVKYKAAVDKAEEMSHQASIFNIKPLHTLQNLHVDPVFITL